MLGLCRMLAHVKETVDKNKMVPGGEIEEWELVSWKV